MRYLVQHNYRAKRDGQSLGFDAGTVVDLAEADAEWVNRDSPGCLSPKLEESEEPVPRKVGRPKKAVDGGDE